MEREEHIKRHLELHANLDELVADFISHTGKTPSGASILELIQWSFKQTTDPEEL